MFGCVCVLSSCIHSGRKSTPSCFCAHQPGLVTQDFVLYSTLEAYNGIRMTRWVGSGSGFHETAVVRNQGAQCFTMILLFSWCARLYFHGCCLAPCPVVGVPVWFWRYMFSKSNACIWTATCLESPHDCRYTTNLAGSTYTDLPPTRFVSAPSHLPGSRAM